jgi:protein-tyrosine phosphatase
METKVVKLDADKPDKAKIKEAGEVIDAGGLVAIPTETVYGIACRVSARSLERLGRLKGRGPGKAYTLHIGQKGDVRKYVPKVGIRASKLIERAWPGPLTVVFELEGQDVEKQRHSLEGEVFEGLYRNNSIGIRCPDNLIASMLLREARSAAVAPSANTSGQEPAVSADEVFARFCGQIEVLLDGGPCKYKKSSTVAKIGKKGVEVLRQGVYSQPELEEMSQVKFLFVCTGNTCRSPMAEGMFRKYLAEKLECGVDQLDEVGYKTFSAGVVYTAGFTATPEAIAACGAKGVDINGHKSKALSEQLVKESDYIFAMCRMHRERVVALNRGASDKCVLLVENEDIADPIGQPQQVYNSCAELIEKAVKKRIGELVI